MIQVNPQIHDSWKEVLMDQFNAPYFLQLKEFLLEEKKKQVVFPPGHLIFHAFDQTPFEQVKVIILGQDPYHGAGQAHGLCFSVPQPVKPPPSLVNIFKEIEADLGIPPSSNGNLEHWARQGVLLLNATLTVRANEAGSHQHRGWETFTDHVIKMLSERRNNLVFLLWGNYARAKKNLVDTGKHFVLEAAHPSPFSAYSGFMGCRHFSKTNELLRSRGLKEIDWSI